ncbi:GNAT family N-acetyltransferase [Flavobacterium ponti]|uniref:GNAT family N-acetyltransferase n=1 Tax=Flavobacterium ponti TaxID=665133 RepID=A0ABV9P336_9FLAO
MKTTIKELKPEAIYPIRHEVLRKGKPFETTFFEGDHDEKTKHFGLILENKVVGVVSVYKKNCDSFEEKEQFQIRGMAILEEFQKKGFGKLLIEKAEADCSKQKADLIWFNARESAKKFYENLNYKINGKPFDIENVGLHYIMFKKLK